MNFIRKQIFARLWAFGMGIALALLGLYSPTKVLELLEDIRNRPAQVDAEIDRLHA